MTTLAKAFTTLATTRMRTLAVTSAALAAVTMLTGCSPERLVNSTDTPSNVVLPSAIETPAGAANLYNAAVNIFAAGFGGSGNASVYDTYVSNSGLFTDELTVGRNYFDWVDNRNNGLNVALGNESAQSSVYLRLQAARVAASQARQALQLYAPAGNGALIGRMYAYEAYSIVLLGEYFCNGIPLTKTPLKGDPVYGPALSTTELFDKAIALFDTAATLSADSAQFANLAKVGKGRALLNEAKFAEAAAAVAGVPPTFVFNLEYKDNANVSLGGLGLSLNNQLGTWAAGGFGSPYVAMQDHEGTNGLAWSADGFRVPELTGSQFGSLPYPGKYVNGNAPIRLADGLEAQLIRAEAELNAGSPAWLDTLNSLRTTCTSASGCAPTPGITATTLGTLTDPGTSAARRDTLFHERARWLYLTGHRQGDLRREARAPYTVPTPLLYPTGTITNPNYRIPSANYGNDVVALPSNTEQKYNPNYKGCTDRNP